MEDAWNLARETTQLVRQRKNLLYTFGTTKLPYLCLTASRLSENKVWVHEGVVSAQRPHITLPGGQGHQFKGFDSEPGDDWPDPSDVGMDGEGVWVRIARRFALPAAEYQNETKGPRSEQGPLQAALERTVERLERENDIKTAILTADGRIWRLGVFLYVASQMARSAESNIREHIEHRVAGMGGFKASE